MENGKFFEGTKKWGGVRPKNLGVLTPKIPPASAPLCITIYTYLLYLPKTKKFGYVGRGDLTSLFKSCAIDQSISQGRLVLQRGK